LKTFGDPKEWQKVNMVLPDRNGKESHEHWTFSCAVRLAHRGAERKALSQWSDSRSCAAARTTKSRPGTNKIRRNRLPADSKPNQSRDR